MANPSNEVQLVVTVEVDKANQSIKSVNANLSGIEQSAVRAARGASAGIDGMTASMVKGATAGNLLADAIKKALEFAKEWTVEAAKEAAHTERAAVVARSLAKAHGDGAAAAQKAIDAIKEVGYATSDATAVVQKLIIADIGLDKATGLAKIAKDASAVSTEGIGAAEAFEKIMMAIETGQSRGLRTLNLFPDLAKAEQVATLQAELHGKTLSELEIKQVRYNAIVEAAIAIQGSAEAQAGTFDGQMKKLDREMKDLKDDVGKAFQGELMMVVGILKTAVGFFKDHTDVMEKFGKGVLVLVGIIATITAATKAWALAQGALNLAMSMNPAFLLAGGIIGAGAVIWKEYSDMQEGWERRTKEMEKAALRKDVLSGKVKIEDLKKRGMDEDQIRELVSGRKLAPGESFEGFDTGVKIKIGGGPDPEALKLQLEIRKRQKEAEKFFADRAIQASGAGKTGYAKDVAEIDKEIASHTSYVDDKGVSHFVPLSKAAIASIMDEARKKFDAFKEHVGLEQRKQAAEIVKDIEEEADRRNQYEAKRYQDRLKNDTDIAEKNLDHLRDVYAFEEQRAGFERDAKLRQLDGVDAQTIQQKVAVEQQKAAIEIEYLQKVHDVKQALYDIDTRRLLLEEDLNLKRLGYKADEIKARIAELEGQRKAIRDDADEANDEAIKAARENAANRTAQMVREHNRQIFESLKQQAGGVFDALLQKSQSVWSAIGNAFKTAILTAIKDVVTSRVAAMLMQLFTGQKVSFAGGGAGLGGSGGILGGLGGLLGIGAVPVFASTSPGGPVPGGAAGGWGTPPFIPGATPPGGWSANAGGSKGGFGGLFSLANWKSLASWKNLYSAMTLGGGLMMLSGAQKGSAFSTIGGGALMGAGIGLSGGPIGAIGGAGIGLYIDAMRRGGWGGVAEGTAGGAMFGWNVGGPLGAAIGAGVGFLSGLVRLFVNGATQKAHDKIKSIYGVDISDKAVLQQVVDIAKQTYGGNLDMAIRTQQVRDLIQLYAMSTGQNVRGMANTTPQALNLMESGGSLYQPPGYSNGTPLPGLGGLPVFDSIGGGVASGAGLGTTVVNLQIDSQTVGSVVLQNGRVVAQGMASAMKANVGRKTMATLQLSPGLVTQ